jgi:hypothetical protein
MAATLAPNGQSTQEFDFVLRDPVLSSTNVTTLSFQMAWTDEVLTPTGPPTIMGSFTLANPNDYHYNVGQGTADIKLTNTAGAATAAGTQIGKIIMRPSIGKTSTTTVMIQQAKFDSVAEVCHIGAKSAGDIVTITVAPLSCSDTILKNYFNDRPYVDSFSITPNPVRGTTGPGILSFRTLADGELTTDIVDVSGKSVMTLSHDIATRGSFALEIPASRLAEGTYFARVRLAGFTLIRKFIVQKN